MLSNTGAGCLFAPTLPVAVLGIFDIGACWYMLAIHKRPAGITGMRHIATGHYAVQPIEFPHAHHASVCAPRPSRRLWREQLSSLLLGCFDLSV